MGSLRQHVQTGASVVESAMSRVGSGTAGAGLLADRGDAESRLRRTVAAGPGGAVEVGDTVLGGVLRSVADEVVITAGLAVAGHVDRRSRVLTGVVVVAAVLGLCLFRRENYDLVLARVLAGSPRRVIDGGPPTGQALSTGGTRWILAARLGCSGLSEQHLVDQLLDTLLPGTLNLADRNFFSMARWVRCTATGAHLAWRVKNGAKSLPARIVRVLSDGSAVLRLHESDAMLTARRAKTGDRNLPRLPDIPARLVEFTLAVTDSTGRARTSRFRILTTLLDHEQYPAGQIAAVYAERWQVEVIYLRVKSTLRGAGTRLRGQTPALAVQEIWGLLTVYNALVGLAVAAAVVLGVDPDAISFAAVLALTRTSATTDLACVQCGHRSDPVDDLVTAITAQPRNRTTRKRTSPRTKTQRQTERTRDVSYTITIVASNLPKDQ